MDSSLKIIKAYKLEKYLKTVLEKNTGNNNPYHNLYHELTVLKNVYMISKSLNIGNKETKMLLIASLFHDFDHSGGKLKDDSKNIELAVNAFKKYTLENEKDTEYIISLINSTKFPYDEKQELTTSEKILRDADLLQSCETNFTQQILLGLNKEFGNDILSTSFLENQIKFTSGIKFFSEYAKNRMEKYGESNNESCEFIIKVLENK